MRLPALRRRLPWLWTWGIQLGSVALVLLLWWALTWGAPEERVLSPLTLPSPGEVLRSFRSLWFDAALTRSTGWSLGRIVLGFGLATLVGVPLGIFAGCFRAVEAFLRPSTLFLRNVPIAALIPLTLVWFGLGETQKVFFLFIACVAFVIFDTTRAVLDVDERYVETAYTLGAKRRHVVWKVLIPIALPDIFNSLRLLFGLAFGYIVLAELIDAKFGLGYIIQVAQRRGPREHIYWVLLVISLLAFATDRLLLALQRRLFPYRFAEG
ncbi:MAG TPA: ABC transporter permease [Thermoanaerobaculia bacterium]|nr:ABC transporter permease [Thermoanaerobaculia bacterium]